MPLGNYVLLENGVPERMHFAGYVMDKRDITDPRTLQPTTRNVCVFTVDRLNGKDTSAMFSVMAEKLFAQLSPYLPRDSYKQYEWVITKTGSGFTTNYSVERIPIS